MDVIQIKKLIASQMITKLPKSGIIALGSGSTVNEIIKNIATNETKYSLEFISASSGTSLLLESFGLKEINLDFALKKGIKFCIDGADQVILSKNQLIKGHGNALFREKIIWNSSNLIYVCIDETKLTDFFTEYIPVEISPFAFPLINSQLKSLLGNNFHFKIKSYRNSMPLITDNGNYILEIHYDKKMDDLESLKLKLDSITGIIETGIFINKNSERIKYVIGHSDKVDII